MFLGEFFHSVDDKGRVAMPAKYRDQIEKGAILTRGNDASLTIYLINEWEKLVEKLMKLPQSKTDVRNYARLVLAGAVEIKLDKQGRINIPKYLLDFAQINKKVVFVGLYDKVEIWDEQRWMDYRQEIESQSTDVLGQLGEFGI
ncbi:MAG: division/cell wall cluster transcriptional repressor MraZ [Patescibacteria group bacterium]